MVQSGITLSIQDDEHSGLQDAAQRHGRRSHAHASWAVVSAVVAWMLWSLRATVLPVAYLNDASIHEQMVRDAARLIQSGHDPLTAWFPYLGEGSPQFLHYQSLGAMVTGLAGSVVGADAAFRWSLLLLLAFWPVVIFLSARIIGFPQWTAAAAAGVAPFIASVPSVGYEHGAYLWVGFGLWAQLWASWTLPLAWAFTWRSMEERKFLLPAALSVALTVGFHFETGYLALLPILVFPFVVPSRWRARLLNAAALLAGSLLASAWVLIPLIKFGKWAAINQVLQGTPLVNGYGAKRILSWLFTGQVFDAGRFPIISLCILVGSLLVIGTWRRRSYERAIMVMGALCLLLAFGRTTFGGLVAVIPGSTDIFFRRLLMGFQLAGVFLAGIGIAEGSKFAARGARWLSNRWYETEKDRILGNWVLLGTMLALLVVAAGSAVVQVGELDERNDSAILTQRSGESIDAPRLAPLVVFVEHHGGGRVYAGLPTNWGERFTVGSVPVFKYLESDDVDEVGYTLRTASLMTDPEYYFDEKNASDYTLFGVRYLLLPSGKRPPIEATAVMRRGPYSLWEVKSNGYFDVVSTDGAISADRANLASRTLFVQHSRLIAHHRDVVVEFAGEAHATARLAPDADSIVVPKVPGTVLRQHANLAEGSASCTVDLRQSAVVMLSASFDPGWTVTVDGRAGTTEMLAPALVGVKVGRGTHRIDFTYVGFGDYPELLAIGVIGFFLLAMFGRRCKGVIHVTD